MEYKWTNTTLSLYEQDVLVAEIGFSLINDNTVYVVERTWVNDSYRGQGIANKITTILVQKILKEHKKILPICTFTSKFMQNHLEYSKILAKR